MNPSTRIGTVRTAATATSAAMWPEQDGRPPHRGQQQAVEVLVLHVEHERRCAGHAGDAEQDRRRHLERRVVEARDATRSTFFRVAMFTMKKNSAMKIGGMTARRSRGTARRARPAMDVRSWSKPGRACPDDVTRRSAVDRVLVTVVMTRSSSVSVRSMWVPVSSRNTSSSVGVRRVRSRTCHLAPASATATGLMVADPLLGGDDQLVAVRLDAQHPGMPLDQGGHAWQRLPPPGPR